VLLFIPEPFFSSLLLQNFVDLNTRKNNFAIVLKPRGISSFLWRIKIEWGASKERVDERSFLS
jgi:hypothetical protein